MMNLYLVVHDLPLIPSVATSIHMPTFINNTFRLKVLLSILDNQILDHPVNPVDELAIDITED